MDEIEREVIKAGADAVAAPVTKIIGDLVALSGGNWLSHKAKMQRERLEQSARYLSAKSKEILKERGVEPDAEAATEHIEQIVEAAGETSHLEIIDLYAALLAAAVDPQRKTKFRRGYVDIVRGLEPLDALVLSELRHERTLHSTKLNFIATELNRGQDEIDVSFDNLKKLELVAQQNIGPSATSPNITSKGRQFLAVVFD